MSKLFEKPLKHLSAIVPTPASPSPEFPVDQRRLLLRIAHDAILSYLEHQPLSEASVPTELEKHRGLFTTLYLPDDLSNDVPRQLRGCVGYPVPVAPLYRAVAETARAAAFEDRRFPPVTKPEALKLQVSLSVLSPLFAIHPEAVEVGRHGLLISDGSRRGLLLPQVPLEHGWDREAFLEQTCRKAGLTPDAWRKSANVEAFTAEVFSDFDVDLEVQAAHSAIV